MQWLLRRVRSSDVGVGVKTRPGFGGELAAACHRRVDKHVATEHQEDANEVHGFTPGSPCWGPPFLCQCQSRQLTQLRWADVATLAYQCISADTGSAVRTP